VYARKKSPLIQGFKPTKANQNNPTHSPRVPGSPHAKPPRKAAALDLVHSVVKASSGAKAISAHLLQHPY
jgi:hypothetical protein